MHHFPTFQCNPCISLNNTQALIEISFRQLIIFLVLYLYHQGWPHVHILMLAISLPMQAFIFPVLCSFRQIGHLSKSLSCLGMMNLDFILQQTRCSHLIWSNLHLRQLRRIGRFHQFIESLQGSTHAYYQRHGRHIVCLRTEHKLLHDAHLRTNLIGFGTTMSLINDNHKFVTILLYRVAHEVPTCIVTAIAILHEIAVYPKFLGVHIIDDTQLEFVSLEVLLIYCYDLAISQFVSHFVEFILALLIQFRRITNPKYNGIVLSPLIGVASIESLDECRHDDGLTSTCRSSKRYDVFLTIQLIATLSLHLSLSQTAKCFILKIK